MRRSRPEITPLSQQPTQRGIDCHEQFMTIFIKEPWATPNRATPKSCYPFNNLNKSKKTQQFKKTFKKINPTIQKETRNHKKKKNMIRKKKLSKNI